MTSRIRILFVNSLMFVGIKCIHLAVFKHCVKNKNKYDMAINGGITAVIKEDSVSTQAFDQVTVLDGVFQTMTRKRGEIRVCQQFLRECMFILSVTVGLNLISAGWVCSAVRLFSHRHTLRCLCEVPKADRLAVTSAPYLEITQKNGILQALAILSGY